MKPALALNPFYLSFVVTDLEAVKRFYRDVLDCTLGRDAGGWVDVWLFGHQLTIHQASAHRQAKALDHFGVLLEKPGWQTLAQRLNEHGIAYVLTPRVLAEGGPDESGKLMLNDPAGNLLEFKYYVTSARDIAAS